MFDDTQLGVPCVDVGLVAGSQAALALCEPVEEHGGLLICSPARFRLDRVIGLFSALARSLAGLPRWRTGG